MWELIKANRRKSIILFVCLAACLLALGYIIGVALFPPDGGLAGLFIAATGWVVFSLVSVSSGDAIFLRLSYAKEISHDIHPQLFNVAEEMKIAANLPAIPKLYVIDSRAPNAFATGIKSQDSAIAVTTGLLAKLNRDELQGVVAHETAHILNRDVQFVTLAGILLGSITLISEVFLKGLFYSGGASSRRFSSGRSGAGGGQAQIVLIVVAVVCAILAPILARIFYFAISRKREYLADATASRLTRYPEGLASALEKISFGIGYLPSANKITAPMYIINPLKQRGMEFADEWSSTHPPVNERINILRAMMGGVNYRMYQSAFEKIRGSKESLIPGGELLEKENVRIRKPHPETLKEKTTREQLREIGDLTRAANGFMFAVCVCGLKVKVPPNFKKSKVACPRCKRDIEIPIDTLVAMNMMAATTAAAAKGQDVTGKVPESLDELQKFRRKSTGWESVRCKRCGHLMQISPKFAGTHMRCYKCSDTIKIESLAPA
jgi:heat shock protein HtpX